MLREIHRLLRETGEPQDPAYADIVEGVLKARGKDIPFPTKKSPVSRVESADLLQQTMQEYKENPYSPEAVTKFCRAFWQVNGPKVGLSIDVPDCHWTKERLEKPMLNIEGKPIDSIMLYYPEQFKGKEGLVLLGRMFPEMSSYSVQEGTPITNDYETTGYIRVEASIHAPNLNTTEDQLREFFASQGRKGQREATYVVASQESELLTDKYFDEDTTASRLLGSRDEGRVIYAHFHSDGHLRVHWRLLRGYRDSYFGGRSEEV